MQNPVTIELYPALCGERERSIAEMGALRASLFRYDSGVEALRLRNARGELVVLPWLGGMVWSARFDGVDLTMASAFSMPQPARTIAETYGCFAFHSGLLRNGVPSAADDHPAHGEFPCAPMQRAWLELGENGGRPALRVLSEREYVRGFGAHYRARPAVTLREADTLFDIALTVENLSGRPMELMYMCHVNFAYVPGGRFVQPAPFSPEHTLVRRAVPAHVRPTPDYLDFVEALAGDPARMMRLDEPDRYDPEQVFYLRGLGVDDEGLTSLMLRRPDGDAFAMTYAPAAFPHTARWVLHDPDQKVAAFALPSTCEPEGYLAEKRKGNVRELPPHGRADFALTTGYLGMAEAVQMEERIAALRGTVEDVA